MQQKLIIFIDTTKHKLKNLSISNKLIVSFSVIVIFMVTLSAIDFSYYKNDKINTTLNTVNQMNSQTVSELDSYLSDLSNLSKLSLFFTKPNIIEALQISNSNPYSFVTSEDDFSFLIDSIFSLKNDLHSVFLFNMNGQSIYKIANGSSLSSTYYPSDEPWFKNTIDAFGSPVITPTYTLNNITDNSSDSNIIFSVSRALVDYSTGSVVGVISLNGSIESISDLINTLKIYDGQRILLVGSSNEIIYDTVPDSISNILSEEELNRLNNSVVSDTRILSKNNNISTAYFSESFGWKLYNIIPYNSLNKDINRLRNFSYVITLFFIIISLFFIIVISKQIVHPIRVLSRKMKLVENGDFDISVKIDSADEVGELSESFNTMTERLSNLINEVYISELNQKELELKMLQNQINPHFLYNTLESIHMMAEANDDFEVSKMSTDLGKILRYGLNTTVSMVTVKDELNNIKTYMELQRIRLDNIDSLVINVDASLLNHKIVKLVFQPIVENSIYHGLSSVYTGGVITVTSKVEDSNLVFYIHDNGVGIDEDTLNKLNGYINCTNDEFSSIGLRNVNMRLKLNYGSNYGIYISSELNNGTTVKVVIPKQNE